MSEPLGNYLVSAVRSAGVPAFPELIELVLPEAKKVADSRGLALEFAVVEQAKATYAEAVQGKFAQKVDFPAFVREKLGKKDSLLSKLIGRKSKVQEAIAELEQYEAQINEARAGLKASEAKVIELRNSIESTEAELQNHSSDAVEASILEAAKIWQHKDRNPHNQSIVAASVSHAVEAEVVNRILKARLILLRDNLTAEEKKVEGYKKTLKDLEKQS